MPSLLDQIAGRLGYQRKAAPQAFEKAKSAEPIGLAQNPMALAYAAMQTQYGLRRPSQITMQTLRRMSRANWVDRTCITTLRDQITTIPWNIIPVDTHKPFDEGFQQYLTDLLRKPNVNKENWRTFIDKTVEDILVVDGGAIEKVRNRQGQIIELWQRDGSTIKPLYDEHGVAGDPAYQQFLADKNGVISTKPVAEWSNDDMVYIMWNPMGTVDLYGFGLSPVEAGLAVGTAFLYAEAYNLGFFRQNSIPPVIINLGKDVDKSQVDKFQAFLAAEMTGPDGFHKPIVTGGAGEGFDIKQLLKAPTEMGFKDYVEWQMRWKVALYRMSPQDIGFSLDQYKVEGQVQQQLSKNKAINSLKGVLRDYINAEILGDKGFATVNQNLMFDWVDTVSVDPLVQAQVDKIYVQTAVQPVNEIRQRLGLDPVEGGDEPVFVAGNQVMPLQHVEENSQIDLEQKKNPPTPPQAAFPPGKDTQEDKTDEDAGEDGDEDRDEDKDQEKSVRKSFSPDEGLIVSLAENQTAVCWMDDRGVTQPLFVADYGKTKGFTIKPAFLDEKKGQEPPEAKVADLLRLLQVNTPEVRILSYDDTVKLLPTTLYPDFTRWINVQAPFDSVTWRERWGDTRKSPYYIVTGLLTGMDLGNEQLQEQMKASPESCANAVSDLARVWLAERRFYLGDRKPGHYLITDSGNGFGVDYQFFEDQVSWEKTNQFLPKLLGLIHPSLLQAFNRCIKEQAMDFGVEKALPRPPTPSDWERNDTVTELEKTLAQGFQQKIYRWYQKAVAGAKSSTIAKSNEFDPEQPYLTNGDAVYQNGVKFPVSVLPANKQPSKDDLSASVGDYRPAFDYGSLQARISIKTDYPNITVRNPELYAPAFEKRINYLSDSINTSMKQAVDDTIVRGIDGGKTYGEIADDIQQTLGVDPNNPDFPGWRAERIARTECLPGETLVDGAVVEAIYRRRYTGDLVEVTTRSGRKFSATPNHPMLTTRGWLLTGEISEGDDLVCNAGDQRAVSAGDKDVQTPPATLSEIFDSVAAIGVIERRRGTKPDFHGDGMEGEVDVLRPNGELRIGTFSPLFEPAFDNIFESTNALRTPTCTNCTRLLSIDKQPCRCTIPDGDIGVTQALDDELPADPESTGKRLAGLSPAVTADNQIGIDVVPEMTAPESLAEEVSPRLSERPVDPGAPQDSPDSLGVVMKPLGNIPDAEAGDIELDNVVSVVMHEFDGYVYNLSTPYGYYTINGGEYTGNTMWSINEGMRQQYQAVGIRKVNVDIAPNACDKCVDVARGNPYDLAEAEGLVPAHSNCRCILVGDYTDLLS